MLVIFFFTINQNKTMNYLLETENNIRKASIESHPFKHSCFQYFPLEFYQKLYADLPSDETYQKYSTPFPDNAYPDRYRLILSPDNSCNGEIFKHNSLWITLIEWLHRPEIIDLYLDKYNITKRNKMEYYLSLQLVRDYQNYTIQIHADSAIRQVTSLIYFPNPESDKNDGTVFFKDLKENRQIKDSKEKFDFDDNFQEVKKFPYQTNLSVDFQVSENSWHGVYPTKSSYRDTLQIVIMAKKKNKL